jgi:quercetin dioxygenase-like cupin family protein
MIKHNLTEFWRGWFIGNFEPAVLKTNQFEVGLLTHKKGEIWPKHYHAQHTEYNLLVKGSMYICGSKIEEGEIFVLEHNEVADPYFYEDCLILCIKQPSIPGDKHEVL